MISTLPKKVVKANQIIYFVGMSVAPGERVHYINASIRERPQQTVKRGPRLKRPIHCNKNDRFCRAFAIAANSMKGVSVPPRDRRLER
jgi:hypothetical protein